MAAKATRILTATASRLSLGEHIMSVRDRILTWLMEHGVHYKHLTHDPTPTSEDAALARGEELRIGGKALLLKVNDSFHLFVLPADRKMDSAAIKRKFKAKKLRFATADELATHTGLVPGAVPPFGEPILPFDVFVDRALTQNDRIAFNAGSLTDSVVMSMTDYLRLARPALTDFSI